MQVQYTRLSYEKKMNKRIKVSKSFFMTQHTPNLNATGAHGRCLITCWYCIYIYICSIGHIVMKRTLWKLKKKYQISRHLYRLKYTSKMNPCKL